MHTKYSSSGLFRLVRLLFGVVFLLGVVEAVSKGQAEGIVGREEFEHFQNEVAKKFEKIMVGITKDESLRGPPGTKGEKGETGLAGADANVGLVNAIFDRVDRVVQRTYPGNILRITNLLL